MSAFGGTTNNHVAAADDPGFSYDFTLDAALKANAAADAATNAPPPGSDQPGFDWAAWLQSLIDSHKGTTPDEATIKAQNDEANNKANQLYQQLTAFQTTQASVNSSLLLQAQNAAKQPGALLPDKSGEVVYGGSASATKVGLGDLMLG